MKEGIKNIIGALGAVAIGAAVISWVILVFFVHCENPICRIIDAYTYRVKSLEEYSEYIKGADLHATHRARVLTFSCDDLRDQLVNLLHGAALEEEGFGKPGVAQEEVIRLNLIGARSDGHTLHLMSMRITSQKELENWSAKAHAWLEDEAKGKGEGTALVVRLFDAVTFHAGDKEQTVPLPSKFKCGR